MEPKDKPIEDKNLTPDENATGETQNTVPHEEKQRATGSSFYKTKIEEMQKQNAELMQRLEAQETQRLEETQNFKQLWENERAKREAAEQKAQERDQTFTNTLKSSAIKNEALKAGILEHAVEDLAMLDTSMVEIETTSHGSFNVLGAKDYIEALREQRPHWFGNVGAPNVNTSSPVTPQAPKELSPAEIVKLQKSDPQAYQEHMKKLLSR